MNLSTPSNSINRKELVLNTFRKYLNQVVGETIEDNVINDLSSMLPKILFSLTSEEIHKKYGLDIDLAKKIEGVIKFASFVPQYRLLVDKQIEINEPFDAYDFLRDLSYQDQEVFVVLTLDSQGRIINRHHLYTGTINSTLIHPREIFSVAFRDKASSFIMAHNHPSDSRLNESDVEAAKSIMDISEQVKMPCVDHIIITKDSYYSVSEEVGLGAYKEIRGTLLKS